MKEIIRLRLLAIKAAILFLGMLTVNALANILPLNGVPTGVLSDRLPNLFVPSGLTFAVWGVIYSLLLGHIWAIFATCFSNPPKIGWSFRDGVLFCLNAAFNGAWIFAWHWQELELSLILMFGILLTLIMLMERNHASQATWPSSGTTGEKLRRFLLRTPILVYLGWICVATIANVTALLVRIGWNGFGISEVSWTVLMLIVGTLVALILLVQRRALSASLVFIWAYAGIILKRLSVDAQDGLPIILTAACAILAIGGAGLWLFVFKKRNVQEI